MGLLLRELCTYPNGKKNRLKGGGEWEYSHLLHNDNSVKDRLHIQWWSHKIITDSKQKFVWMLREKAGLNYGVEFTASSEWCK